VCYAFRVIDWSKCPAVESRPGKLNGTWVFRGTRVPVETLLASLDRGLTISEFLDQFEGVSRESVSEVLNFLMRESRRSSDAAVA
jgi:uncharacterized protein (DUF433 family)